MCLADFSKLQLICMFALLNNANNTALSRSIILASFYLLGLFYNLCENIFGVKFSQLHFHFSKLKFFGVKFANMFFNVGKSAKIPKNNNPGLHHLQGGIKFTTQISPLLNS